MPCVTQLIVVDEADSMVSVHTPLFKFEQQHFMVFIIIACVQLRLFPDKLFAISCTQSIADRKILVSFMIVILVICVVKMHILLAGIFNQFMPRTM